MVIVFKLSDEMRCDALLHFFLWRKIFHSEKKQAKSGGNRIRLCYAVCNEDAKVAIAAMHIRKGLAG